MRLRAAAAALALADIAVAGSLTGEPGPARGLSRLAAFVSLVGSGFSAWLTYVEPVKIEAACQWCVVSALLLTALAAVSVARLPAA